MTMSPAPMSALVADGSPRRSARADGASPGAEALSELLVFASRAADASPDVARVALLGWSAVATRGFPVAVVLRDAAVDLKHQRAVRKLVQAAAIPTLEAGMELAFYVVPAGHPQADAGVTLWPPVATEAAAHGPR